ncbi:MAG: TlyA family RNA methyltransferase [Nitriliruptoraceae bacterium]
MSTVRRRLDAELVRRKLVASRAEAQMAIESGLVSVDGAPGLKSATLVHAGQTLSIAAPPRRYVSRGGDKLHAALEHFSVDPSGRRCLDAGVSAGGFTDCLLQHGATHVVAVDVGYGQVHERIRTDERVTLRERFNVRDLAPDVVGPIPPDLLVADLSFISVASVLATMLHVLSPSDRGCDAIVLVKPQFEGRRQDVGKGGIVRDAGVWSRVLTDVATAADDAGWSARDVVASPIRGQKGNVEFLMHLRPSAPDAPMRSQLMRRITRVVAEQS